MTARPLDVQHARALRWTGNALHRASRVGIFIDTSQRSESPEREGEYAPPQL
jgi:hypothetical protein